VRYSCRVVAGGSLVVARAQTTGDVEALPQLTDEVRRANGVTPGFCTLVDLRRRADLPSARAARQLAEALVAANGKAGRRVALVARPGAQYGIVRITETLARLEGADVRVFTAGDDAMDWLREEDMSSPSDDGYAYLLEG
jgi:hypothetical protein